MTIAEASEQYLAALAAEGRSPNTQAAYRRDLRAFIAFAGDAELAQVTPALLQRFIASPHVQLDAHGQQRAKATVNRYRVTLKALFAWADARWLTDRNPTAVLKCRRHRGLPPEVLSDGEVERVLAFPFAGRHGERDWALLCFMLTTGCRLGETAALDCGDIDLERATATLRTTKGGDPDRVPLTDRCVAAVTPLMSGRTPDTPLFRATGGRLSTRQVQRIVVYRVQEAGITKPVTAHTLRHTFATGLYNRTGDIRLVQIALRHEHVQTTEIYAHLDPQRLRRAIGQSA